MKILIVHNFHRQGSASGDDAVVMREAKLLKSHGHEIKIFKKENTEIYSASPLKRMRMAVEIPWSRTSYTKLKTEIEDFQPDLVHFHNFFPLLSPSVYLAAYDTRRPLVQSLHDYRFFCPAAFFFRNGKLCEECPKKGLHRAVLHRCLRGSLPQSLLAAMATAKARKFLDLITSFVVFSPFTKKKLQELGIEGNRIFIKPHFLLPGEVPDPGERGNFFLFAGRLGEEKGIRILLEAWKGLDLPLRIAGSGPLEPLMKDLPPSITYCGFLGREKILKEISRAYALILPSLCYETFGLTIMEAMAAGVPVLASSVGAPADLVHPGKTGLLFERANPQDLKEKVLWLWEHPTERDRMGREARREFERKFTAEKNYKVVMRIYAEAMERHERS